MRARAPECNLFVVLPDRNIMIVRADDQDPPRAPLIGPSNLLERFEGECIRKPRPSRRPGTLARAVHIWMGVFTRVRPYVDPAVDGAAVRRTRAGHVAVRQPRACGLDARPCSGGLLPRNPDGSSAVEQPSLHEVDTVTFSRTLSF